MTKTINEAQLAVHEVIQEILVSLAIDDDTPESDIAVFEDDMGDVATLIVDALGLKVLSVDDIAGTKFTASLEVIEMAEGFDEYLDASGLDAVESGTQRQ